MRNERRTIATGYRPPIGQTATATTQPQLSPPDRAGKPRDARPKPKPREKAPSVPPGESAGEDDVTVSTRLNRALLAKLDRLCGKHSGGLTKTTRSTLLRWLIEREPE